MQIKALEIIAANVLELLEKWKEYYGVSEMLNKEALAEKLARARETTACTAISQLQAASAIYDRKESGFIIINLTNGATFSFPPKLAQGLAGASPEEVALVEITPSCKGLHWETLDADLSVPALLVGIFGTKITTLPIL